jgi:hypothetical protein
MSILSQLQNNKGTVSSALSKLLAQQVLKGDPDILIDAINLISFEDKNVRSGAAKIIETVAEKKPDYVSPHLSKLLPALEVQEPQTRWMVLHTLGLCAKLDPQTSLKAIPKAKQFLQENSGMCLWDRSITYLGYIGSISEKEAVTIFPILEDSMDSIPERIPRVFEGFERMIPVLNSKLKSKLKGISDKFTNHTSPTIKNKAKRLQKVLSKE